MINEIYYTIMIMWLSQALTSPQNLASSLKSTANGIKILGQQSSIVVETTKNSSILAIVKIDVSEHNFPGILGEHR